ncbi:aldose 1-epimerase [Actinomycetota bacterium]|nr:aldose 1-epimerase [Actinomycetota bacterium]
MYRNPEKAPIGGKVVVLTNTDSQGRQHKASIGVLGAALREYDVDGKDIVVKFSHDGQYPDSFAGVVLFPWPNRLEDGEYTWEGETFTAPINEPAKNTNLHSNSQYYYFEVVHQEANTATFGLRLPGVKYYKFDIYVETTYTLTDRGLEISTDVQNLGDKKAPFALGFHPWFSTRNDRAVSKLRVDAKSVVEVDERALPTAVAPVYGKFDLLKSTQLNDSAIDHAFTDVVLDGNSESSVELVGADGHKTTVLADKNYTSWQICTRSAADGDKIQETVAIEPMTAYANAFKTGKDLTILEPDQTFSSEWRIEFE